jgi:AraC-like DNA-binding protein
MTALTGPQLYRPRPPLSDHVDYFGSWEGGTTVGVHTSRALPRGAVTAIIDVGGRAELGFYASDGHTRLAAPSAFVVGPGLASHVIRIDPTHRAMTIHFRPAGALAYLGCPLGELENAVVGLTELWGRSAELLREQLSATRSPGQRVALLEAFLLDRRRRHHPRPQPWLAPVLDLAESDPSMRVSAARGSIGLPPKRFNAMFRSDVGLTPKAYFRVRRLQAAVRALNTPAQGAVVAANLGYFDQAHFVREFRSFTGMTPTQYAQRRSSMPGHVGLGDRNIQARPSRGVR